MSMAGKILHFEDSVQNDNCRDKVSGKIPFTAFRTSLHCEDSVQNDIYRDKVYRGLLLFFEVNILLGEGDDNTGFVKTVFDTLHDVCLEGQEVGQLHIGPGSDIH